MTDVQNPPQTGTAVRIVPRSERTAPLGPWPEPWRPVAKARPATDYWDCLDASWRCCPPAPDSTG